MSYMYRIFILLVLIFNILQLYAQPRKDSIPFVVEGKVVVEDSELPLKFAHVINMRTGMGGITDEQGRFRTPAAKDDFIRISAIGFFDYYIVVNDTLMERKDPVKIPMKQRIYKIREVSVNQLGSWNQFKERFMELGQEELGETLDERLLKSFEYVDTVGPDEVISLGSPITALYMMFSKEGKSLRKYQELKEEEEFQKKIQHKYNREIVGRITGFEGIELNLFMMFCDYSKDFLLRATEYEIIVAIIEYYNYYCEVTGNPSCLD